MEEKLPSDHRGLKLQNIIQKLSEHCDIKNPLDLEKDDDNSNPQEGRPVKRQKQRESVIVNRSVTEPLLPTDVGCVATLHFSDDLKVAVEKCVTETKKEDTSPKVETPSLPGRISSRIRDLKLKRMACKDEKWAHPEQSEPTHRQTAAQSPDNSLQEENTKVVTRRRRKKRKEDVKSSWSVLSMEDYVNEAPLIQVGNLVGLRQCRLCSVMFVEKEQLINHMKAVHHLDDKVRISNDVVESLQSDYQSKEDKPYKCSQCQSSFRKSSGLKQHVTRQHSQNAPQKFSHAQSTPSLSGKSHNSSDRPYSCQVCGKAFKRKHHLQEHSYIHSEEKPYKCDTCFKTFNQRICLTKHLPCREHEKPHRKPNSTKPVDTNISKALKKGHPEVDDSVNGSEWDVLARDEHVPNHYLDVKAPEVHSVVNGSKCDGKTLGVQGSNVYSSSDSNTSSKARLDWPETSLESNNCVLNSRKDTSSTAVSSAPGIVTINEMAAPYRTERNSHREQIVNIPQEISSTVFSGQ